MTILGKINVVLLGATITIVSVVTPYINELSAIERKVQIRIRDQFIVADVARTSVQREKGLAGRDSLSVNEGLLLLFDKPDIYSIWMKGMKFPIDVVWIKGDRVLGFTENMDPQIGVSDANLTPYYPPEPIDKVLELRAGRVGLLQAHVGDEIKTRLIVPRK